MRQVEFWISDTTDGFIQRLSAIASAIGSSGFAALVSVSRRPASESKRNFVLDVGFPQRIPVAVSK